MLARLLSVQLIRGIAGVSLRVRDQMKVLRGVNLGSLKLDELVVPWIGLECITVKCRGASAAASGKFIRAISASRVPASSGRMIDATPHGSESFTVVPDGRETLLSNVPRVMGFTEKTARVDVTLNGDTGDGISGSTAVVEVNLSVGVRA